MKSLTEALTSSVLDDIHLDAMFHMWRSGFYRTRTGWRSDRFPNIPSIPSIIITNLHKCKFCKIVKDKDDDTCVERVYITERGRKAYATVLKARKNTHLQNLSPKKSDDLGA